MSVEEYKFSGKVDEKSLGDIPAFNIESLSDFDGAEGRFTIPLDGLDYSFLFAPAREEKNEYLFVLLSGHADRQKLTPPVFQRWKWAKRFPGPCLYLADPTLSLSDQIGLGWYVGTQEMNIVPILADIVKAVAEKLGVPNKRIVFYGSSGGGFAAIKIFQLIEQSVAIAINPQTNILAYHADEIVNEFVRVYAQGKIISDENRLNILSDVDALRERKIIYAQNKQDGHHFREHYSPFAHAMGWKKSNSFSVGRAQAYLFSLEGGHNRAEPPEVFDDILRLALE